MAENEMKVLEIGTLVEERYRIVAKLGSGGSGNVYQAEDLHLGQMRALKISGTTEKDEKRARIEASILLRLNHPSIPIVYDFISADQHNGAIIVMELVLGRTLEECLRTSKELSFEQIVAIALQLASVLHYLHSRPLPILHLDLKPDNIMLTPNGMLTLIDFGASYLFRHGNDQKAEAYGTPGFTAPIGREQLQPHMETDLYSFGAFIYYLVYKKTFRGENQSGPIIPLPQRNDIPRSFYIWLSKLLDKNKKLRFAAINEAAMELSECILPLVGKKTAEFSSIDRSLLELVKTSQSDKVAIVAVASLHAGAGASFIAQMMTEMIANLGYHAALMEFHGKKTELQHMISSIQQEKTNSFFDNKYYKSRRTIDSKVQRKGTDIDVGNIYYYATGRVRSSKSQVLEELDIQLACIEEAACECRVIIIDLSSRQQDEVWRYWTKEADYICVAADPSLQKWSLEILEGYSEKNNGFLNEKLDFAAAKAFRFAGLQTFVDSFPKPPVVVLPYIAFEEVLHAVWKYGTPAASGNVRRKLEKPMQPLIKKLLAKMNTKAGRL